MKNSITIKLPSTERSIPCPKCGNVQSFTTPEVINGGLFSCGKCWITYKLQGQTAYMREG